MKNVLFMILSLTLLIACKEEDHSILLQLANNYEQLPEQEIAMSRDFTTYAQYAMPTEKYNHGILGDKIEAELLVVVVDGVFYAHQLPEDYVFEDIRPRLYDVDGDSVLEFICIRTKISRGAGIAIYKIIGGQLLEYGYVPEIGVSYRWLNIVSINDLDNDGVVELAWIETPHIGGILKVAKVGAGDLQVVAESAQYSNHAIGERNLCLSVLTEEVNSKVLYVPNQSRDQIVGFTFKNNELEVSAEISQVVDFSKTLASQYSFSKVIDEEDNCIIVK